MVVFRILINGEEVWRTDGQVLDVELTSARGTAGRMGVADTDGAAELLIREATAGGPVRLDHLINQQNIENRERVSGQEAGSSVAVSGHVLRGGQGEHTYTARPGGIKENAPQVFPFPERDLAADTEPGEDGVEQRNRNIQDFLRDNNADTSGGGNGGTVQDTANQGDTTQESNTAEGPDGSGADTPAEPDRTDTSADANAGAGFTARPLS